nr:MAG TPA: hypothetical protein [Caudoviricetes sp.]
MCIQMQINRRNILSVHPCHRTQKTVQGRQLHGVLHR